MDHFDDLLRDATASIAAEYVLLPMVVRDPVFRECVYCYELYHQLRRRWPDVADTDWRLNGEVDKRSHEYFRTLGARAPKPDFLVHEPGRHRNFAVIEVKSAAVTSRGADKDLSTLSLFCSQFGYERGLFLAYGVDPDSVYRRLQRVLTSPRPAPVELWVHPTAGVAAERVQF